MVQQFQNTTEVAKNISDETNIVVVENKIHFMS